MTDTRMARVAEVLRDVARGGLAGMLAGIVVGGVGGRLVMLVIAQLNRDAFGMLTEAEARIGEFTVPGTLALIFFGGLSAGGAGSVLWVVTSPWVPWTGARRSLLAGLIAVALATFILVESTNRDFHLVGPTWLVLTLLLGLVVLTGAATAWLDERLERRLPHPGAAPGRTLALYGIFAVLGTPALLLTVLAFFSESFASGPMPVGAGWALLVTGFATAALWARRIAGSQGAAPPGLMFVGRAGLVAAVALGTLHVALEIGRIYAKL